MASSDSDLNAGPSPLEDPHAIRRAGRDWLSLALIDSRNHLLRWLGEDESGKAVGLALRAGWFQEHWISRHVQRQRGEACDPAGPRLAGIEPEAEAWVRGEAPLPTPEAARGYLAETLEITLDLLSAAGHDDAALYFYRLCLMHEDRLAETLAEGLRRLAPPARQERPALWLPAQTVMMGTPQEPGPQGLVPHNERWAHPVAVPEFEIDAQPVSWGRFIEFAEDGGYDRPEYWNEAGWDWVQAEGRRAPRHVEQLRGGVIVSRGTEQAPVMQRAPALQPATHISRHEAEAWCRWAGRRLPTEPEWELAARTGAGRGFIWGDVHEWVAGSARAWPGAGAAPPGTLDACPPAGTTDRTRGILRGAAFVTRRRWHHPMLRRFVPPHGDTMFTGFRSCAV
jgi:formylglycine-generating enzyme required for sulfatase activity